MSTNHLRLGTRALIFLLILTSTAFADRMTFTEKGIGGNASPNSNWIAAEGDIVEDSAEDLEKYLKENNVTWTSDVRLHSHGGSLIGGIKLGELIRKHKFSTSVGRTVPGDPTIKNYYVRADGVCESACAIAFIGGLERYADDKSLGIHQFYQEAFLKNPSEKVFDALDMSGQQVISALLIDYAFRMGVDPRFIAMASATPPNSMYYLSNEDLELLKVNWSPKDFEPWSIEVSGRGVIAFAKSKDKTRTAVLFCRADRVPRLFLRPDSSDFTWYAQAMDTIEGISAFGITVPKSLITLKKVDGAPALEFPVAGFHAEQLASLRQISVGVSDGPRYTWLGFSFDLPTKNALSTMAIALKNCI